MNRKEAYRIIYGKHLMYKTAELHGNPFVKNVGFRDTINNIAKCKNNSIHIFKANGNKSICIYCKLEVNRNSL